MTLKIDGEQRSLIITAIYDRLFKIQTKLETEAKSTPINQIAIEYWEYQKQQTVELLDFMKAKDKIQLEK